MGAADDRVAAEVEAANASGKPPVAFVHGLWLLAGSWDAWRPSFEDAGWSTVALAWPGDPDSVAEAKATPAAFAGRGLAEIADHLDAAVDGLHAKPALVGHSFGGMLAQVLAGRGLAAATVAIDPAPFRGILPLPVAALRSAWPVLRDPRNARRAVGLTEAQFRYGFANAIDEAEAKDLYERYSVAGPGRPIFQAATANANPWTQAKVSTAHPDRGPMLVVSGEHDHTVPRAVARAAFEKQAKHPGVTEFHEVEGRGHSLTIDHGWPEVAAVARAFIARFVPPPP